MEEKECDEFLDFIIIESTQSLKFLIFVFLRGNKIFGFLYDNTKEMLTL